MGASVLEQSHEKVHVMWWITFLQIKKNNNYVYIHVHINANSVNSWLCVHEHLVVETKKEMGFIFFSVLCNYCSLLIKMVHCIMNCMHLSVLKLYLNFFVGQDPTLQKW